MFYYLDVECGRRVNMVAMGRVFHQGLPLENGVRGTE